MCDISCYCVSHPYEALMFYGSSGSLCFCLTEVCGCKGLLWIVKRIRSLMMCTKSICNHLYNLLSRCEGLFLLTLFALSDSHLLPLSFLLCPSALDVEQKKHVRALRILCSVDLPAPEHGAAICVIPPPVCSPVPLSPHHVCRGGEQLACPC